MEFNVTLVSVLAIILFFIPGFFFKRFYFSGKFSRQFGTGNFAERVITSIFWGIVIQIIALTICSEIFNITFDNVKFPLYNIYSKLVENKLPDLNGNNIRYALMYLGFVLLLSIAAGDLLHRLVRLFRIDIVFPALRFSNEWNYYFRGELLSRKGRNGKRRKRISTEIDVVAEIGNGKNKLFSGFLTDYTLCAKTGELETVSLKEAKKWSESIQPAGFVNIPGECFIIPYARISNINLRHNFIESNRNKFITATLTVIFTLFVFFVLFVFTPIYIYPVVGWLKTLIVVVLFSIAIFLIAVIQAIWDDDVNSHTRILLMTKVWSTVFLSVIIILDTWLIWSMVDVVFLP